MGKYLTKEEELDLGLKIKKAKEAEEKIASGESSESLLKIVEEGRQAVNKFVENYSNLVRNQAGNFLKKRSNSDEFDDLYQEGMIGLLNAIAKYDIEKNCKMSTYSVYWIKQAIMRNSAKSSAVRMPENKIILMRKSKALREEIIKENPQIKESELEKRVNSALGLKRDAIDEFRRFAYEPSSLDSTPWEEDPRDKISDGVDSINSYFKEEAYKCLYEAVNNLSNYERDVLRSYKMLPSFLGDRITVGEIVKKHNVKADSIRSDKQVIISKIREALLEKGFNLEDFNS